MALVLNQVSVLRGGRRTLDDVSVTCEPGTLTAIIGPNGAGKSTFVRVASGEWSTDVGTVRLDGVSIASMPPHRLASRRAVVPQATQLAFPFTVREVVTLGASVPGFATQSIGDVVGLALASIDAEHLQHRYYAELSGGERQRVNFARALCQLEAGARYVEGSTVLFLDEPTSNLDLSHQSLLLAQAKQQAARGRIVVAVLHDLNLAAAWADRVVVLAAGHLVAQGAVQDVYRNELLSDVYGHAVRVGTVPEPGYPFVLPTSPRA